MQKREVSRQIAAETWGKPSLLKKMEEEEREKGCLARLWGDQVSSFSVCMWRGPKSDSGSRKQAEVRM